MLTGIVSKFVKNKNNDKSSYILYKIVDTTLNDKHFVLQYINTKVIFHIKISELVFDLDILYGLHPIQACYIGIEYSKHIKNSNPTPLEKKSLTEKLNKYSVYRYGKYRLVSQNRKGKVHFTNELSNEDFFMEPRDIALSEELIEEFDAAQAFYIGLLAGLKINNPTSAINKKSSKPYLRIVK